jgi:hypothetical protein
VHSRATRRSQSGDAPADSPPADRTDSIDPPLILLAGLLIGMIVAYRVCCDDAGSWYVAASVCDDYAHTDNEYYDCYDWIRNDVTFQASPEDTETLLTMPMEGFGLTFRRGYGRAYIESATAERAK